MLIAGACLVMFVALLWALPVLSGLDAAVAQLLIGSRTCLLQSVLDQTRHLGYALAALFLVSVALWSASSSRSRLLWRDLWIVLVTIGTGALIVQFLKTFIMRERPSMIPGLAIGHSMPSGDITNGAIALGAALWLARRHPASVRKTIALAGALVLLLVVLLRLAPLRHWFTDATASMLLALGWLSFSLTRFPRGRWWLPFGWAAFLGAALFVVTYTPGLRVRLPSPLTSAGKPVAVWHAAAPEEASNLEGAWSGVSFKGRLPSVALPGGEGAVLVGLPRPAAYRLQFGMLPVVYDTAFACAQLEVTVNRKIATSFVASGGWRQYEVEIPARFTRAGTNRIGLRLLPDRGATELKLSYLALYPD